MPLDRENTDLDQMLAQLSADLIGHSDVMQRLRTVAARVATRSSTVMILGETGTGKEMLARYIHSRSQRANKPFIPVDCTAFSESLFESQLFGHVKGAYTGAHRDSLGFIRSADGGTIFFDEVGELGMSLQAKLLRVLQERRVVPVGDVTARPVDIRVICATHRNLPAMVADGSFRQDLFFRLQVFSLNAPPLRDRKDDLLLLAEHYLDRLAELNETTPKRLSVAAAEALLRHHWPGNVRELFNVIEHAHVLSDGDVINQNDLPPAFRSGGMQSNPYSDLNLTRIEREAILEALKRCRYNRTAACRLLGVELRRLNRRISSLCIDIPHEKKISPARVSDRAGRKSPGAATFH